MSPLARMPTPKIRRVLKFEVMAVVLDFRMSLKRKMLRMLWAEAKAMD